MIKKTIHCLDFNGQRITEEHYFNLTRAELGEREIAEQYRDVDGGVAGGFAARLAYLKQSGTGQEIMSMFKDLLRWSYGKKTPDGRRFIKVDDVTGKPLFSEFEQTSAYDALFSEMLLDPSVAMDLLEGAMPSPDPDKPSYRESTMGTPPEPTQMPPQFQQPVPQTLPPQFQPAPAPQATQPYVPEPQTPQAPNQQQYPVAQPGSTYPPRQS